MATVSHKNATELLESGRRLYKTHLNIKVVIASKIWERLRQERI